ncbi:murein L,D-transpeptidase [Rhizocola hellebori]|uniref:Murein L,D-transpeptidase n=1 Tax=Rhizocola hellebori TaxID=1392758 RepID=A0A8J3QI47_9ACTN|nr:L,D-transpeptidase family protein [Rhizocola hellebori]GIH09696.1 murein L,D-transpeptidase [Rhizocola hellebori]
MKRFVLGLAAVGLAVGAAACQPTSASPVWDAGGPTSSAPSPTASPSETPAPAPTTAAPSPTTPATTAPAKPVCTKGKYQLEVEQILVAMGGFGTVKADGEQSDSDCAAIKKFQSRFGLRPVDGNPGTATHDVAKRLKASDPSLCEAGTALTACIDLTHQTTWLMKDGKVIHGPTVTRTGFNHPDGHGAPTPSGTYKIIERQRNNWTETFKVYLPYWQRIMDDNGFHETTSYIHDMSLGSHGCVNLLHVDAVAYWDTITVGTTVKLFGRRPGT